MTPQEGLKILKEKFPNKNVVSCIEFSEYYLYATVPNDFKPIMDNGKPNTPMDSSYLVNKNTSEVSTYNPLINKVDGEFKILEDFEKG